MNRIKCTVAYDGSGFNGYQVQPGKRTVQGEIEKVLQRIHKGDSIRVQASGRTDAGVHAMGQVFHFDTSLQLDHRAWKKAINVQLPKDVSVLQVEKADSDFHARFSSKAKEYRYRVLHQEDPSPFLRDYTYHYPYPLNMEAMQEVLQYFIGTHDFTSFCSAKTEIEDRVRMIESFQLSREKDELVFKIVGNGFLYNMVRIIVGTVLEVGAGKRRPEDIPKIFEAKNRSLAGKRVPGCGLFLWKVDY